jgi:hypothetical protein
MSKKKSGIVFDRDYTEGLVAAATSEGYVNFQPKSEGDKESINNYISKIKGCRLKKRSLELALLFQNVYLNDPFELTVLDRLQKEGIVQSWKTIPDDLITPSLQSRISTLSEAEFMKPLLINHLNNFFRRTIRPEFKSCYGLIPKYVFYLYDFSILWSAGLYEEAVSTNLPFNALLKYNGDLVTHIGKQFDDLSQGKSVNNFIADTIAIGFEIESILQLADISKRENVSFVTNRLSTYRGKSEIEMMQNSYSLCLIPLQEEIQYAPVVDSIQDLLRLRDKPEIKRFREVLDSWKNSLLDGDVNIAEKMRGDIGKANKEIKKLDKWKKADKWMYYLSLPTILLPCVSNLVTVGEFITRSHIEKIERSYKWIALGR